MNVVRLEPVLVRAWAGQDPFEAARTQPGELAKSKDGRRTLRFEIEGRGAYLKYHPGVGWREIVKNLVQLRLPVVDAGQEYRAARHLGAHGVAALRPLGYGVRGANPAARRSFLVTEELAGTVSLERFCADWRERPPAPRVRRLLIEAVARLVRALHAAGVNHRDLYLCHILLEEPSLAAARRATEVRLHLIDLHRAQIRARVPHRWLAKDLGGLWFSAAPCALGPRDLLRFLRAYLGSPLRTTLARERRLLEAAEQRRDALHARSGAC